MHRAVASGNLEVVKYLIKEWTANVDIKTTDGKNPLYLAITNNDLDIVKCLIEKVVIYATNGPKILYAAIKNHNFDIFEHVIEVKKFSLSSEFLLSVLQDRDLTAVKYLIEKGKIKATDHCYDGTLLHYAARLSNSKIVEYLIEKGGNIDEPYHDNKTPLHYAAEFDNLEVVNYLVKKGAKVNTETKNGKTPLYLAVEKNHPEIVRRLIRAGNRAGNLDMVKRLVENKELDIKSESGKELLRFAVENRDLDIVKCLIEGKKFSVSHTFGKELLCLAVKNSALGIAKYLVEQKGVNVACYYSEESALHFAAANNDLDMVKYLIEQRADPFMKYNGRTPRNVASNENVKQFLKNEEIKQTTKKAIMVAGGLGYITALVVGIGYGIAGVGLPILAIAGIAITAALVVGTIAGGITYLVLKPSDKLDQSNLQQQQMLIQREC